MTTRYRVEYALKSHRRDQFIEWIKGLLAVPFVLYSSPHGAFDGKDISRLAQTREEAHRRYSEILHDVEVMIDDHLANQNDPNNPFPSKLKLLVPTIGPFFTRLPLEAAFKYQDSRRYISSRRFVSPSFNDVRLILNSAQIMAVTTTPGSLQLATFDGDVTLYDDGQSLEPSSPVIPRLLDLLRRDIKIGIVTAAGYTTADKYHARLHGLLSAIDSSPDLTPTQKQSLIVMGGEANYLFRFSPSSPHLLSPVPRSEWLTPEMAAWDESAITALLDTAEQTLQECIRSLNLPAVLLRKDRAVGIIPDPPTVRIPRESLEETVLVVQKALELSPVGRAKKVPFCAFNGGRDVFVDIGDKSWGVTVCQRWFGRQIAQEQGVQVTDDGEGEEKWIIKGQNTLHVGDQFLSAGANDFRARSVGTTAWIASPEETVELLDELAGLMDKEKRMVLRVRNGVGME